MMKIGVIREGKVPSDERVALTPNQVKAILETHQNVSIVVQRSEVRRIRDEEYEKLGIHLVDSVVDCDVLIGVKEVPINELISNKKYFFFSHTIKMQPYNKGLLQAVMDKRISLVDWECLTDEKGNRLIGFGRYAGIVGAYNGFRMIGMRTATFDLKKAQECADRAELELELNKVKLDNIKILLTGRGKVAKGAIEILEALNLRRVSTDEFLNETFNEPVYTQITFKDYFTRTDGEAMNAQHFFDHPHLYKSCFEKFSRVADFFIAGHYWDSNAPFLFTRADARDDRFRIKYISDISCDIDGPVASTLRPSTIADPFYGYDPESESEVDYKNKQAIAVMAVDNLPCELPRDASHDFGTMFIDSVLPALIGEDLNGVIQRGSISIDGALNAPFSYLEEWVAKD